MPICIVAVTPIDMIDLSSDYVVRNNWRSGFLLKVAKVIGFCLIIKAFALLEFAFLFTSS